MTKLPQSFGGPWSVLKVETVESYLVSFSKALKNAGYEKIYIDAFAGSGSFAFGGNPENPGLFDDLVQQHDGSAARALGVQPPFDHLYFLELKRKNIQALQAIMAARPNDKARVSILRGEANEQVALLCKEQDWRRTRGVIFLDPFGNSVKWSTLEAIAQTKALDVWYLFPLLGVFRNAPRVKNKLTPDKKKTITEMLGSDEWEAHFYERQHEGSSLFPLEDAAASRSIDVAGMEKFVHDRLETIFPHVEAPLTIRGPNNAPMFSLFFAVSNPLKRAQEIASKIARHLLTQRSRGTRPKYGR